MNKSHANHSIECTIDECANHCDCEPCCALDRIEICSRGPQKAESSDHTSCASSDFFFLGNNAAPQITTYTATT